MEVSLIPQHSHTTTAQVPEFLTTTPDALNTAISRQVSSLFAGTSNAIPAPPGPDWHPE